MMLYSRGVGIFIERLIVVSGGEAVEKGFSEIENNRRKFSISRKYENKDTFFACHGVIIIFIYQSLNFAR